MFKDFFSKFSSRSKSDKLIAISVVFLLGVLLYFFSQKTICNNNYLENAQSTKNIEDLEICIKEGNVDAAVFLSNMYLSGDNVKTDYYKAVETVKEFAYKEDSKAMLQLALLYSNNPKTRNLEEAEKLYKKTIDKGGSYLNEAKIEFARFFIRKYFDTKDSKYIDLYIALLEEVAKEGNVRAIYMLSDAYHAGIYIKQDYVAAFEWNQRALKTGDAQAYRRVGYNYISGYLGDADYEKARYYFQEAADRGDYIAKKLLEGNPKPLGLEITKATISDFKKKFKEYAKIESPYFINGGTAYFVDAKYIPLDGVKDDVIFAFDKNSKLDSVIILFDKSQYTKISLNLKRKYTPLFPNSTTLFQQGFVQINLFKTFKFYIDELTQYKSSNENFCTLVYSSQSFFNKVHEIGSNLQKRWEEEKKKKDDLL